MRADSEKWLVDARQRALAAAVDAGAIWDGFVSGGASLPAFAKRRRSTTSGLRARSVRCARPEARHASCSGRARLGDSRRGTRRSTRRWSLLTRTWRSPSTARADSLVSALVSDEVWRSVRPLLPPQRPRPLGGRPRVDDRVALAGILFVLKERLAWHRLPREQGFGAGMTLWRRHREWISKGIWSRLRPVLLRLLDDADAIDWSRTYASSQRSLSARNEGTQARASSHEPRSRRMRR
ncbi:MAG: transposase [Polyangiales bacterium]